MKKSKLIKYVMLGSCVGMLSFGCSESDFQKFPKDDVTEGAFFTGAENVRQMLNDAYYTMRYFYSYSSSGFIFLGELPTDNAYNSKFNNSSNHTNLNEVDWQPDNGLFTHAWRYAYETISRCHLAMENAEKVMDAGTLQTRYINEAKYLRALMYFNLVRSFGDVPLVLKDITNPNDLFEYGREPKANVYAQIISDLKDASNLPMKYTENTDIGYATGAAARALLGEVYLTLGQYSDAKTVFAELISSGVGAGYGLMDNYADVFKARYSNNKEIVFAAQFARGFDPSMGNPLVSQTYPNEAVPDPQLHPMLTRGSGTMLITRDLWNAFESTDPRREMIEVRVDENMQNQAVYLWTLKYFDEDMSPDKLDSGADIIVHRWADILLMYAEALNETGATGEALTYLKQVRTRVGLSTDDALGASKDNMFLALELERQRELHLEGHRWFDLVRTGRALAVINHHLSTKTEFELQPEGGTGRHDAIEDLEKGTGRQLEAYRLIFPIPQTQINIVPEKLTQNPGY